LQAQISSQNVIFNKKFLWWGFSKF